MERKSSFLREVRQCHVLTYMQSVSSFNDIEGGCSARQANRKAKANISDCSKQQIYVNLASMGLALVSTADGLAFLIVLVTV